MGPALWFPYVANLVTKVRKLRKSATKLGLAFCGYYTFTSQVAHIYMIDGPSMVPTLCEGDLVIAVPIKSLVWYWAPRGLCEFLLGREDYSNIDRGDVVIAKHPADPTLNIVKRVALLEREYIHSHRARVPAGHTWLLSDDLELGRDSRDYGPVPLGLVHSRVVCPLRHQEDLTK